MRGLGVIEIRLQVSREFSVESKFVEKTEMDPKKPYQFSNR